MLVQINIGNRIEEKKIVFPPHINKAHEKVLVPNFFQSDCANGSCAGCVMYQEPDISTI